MRQLRNMILMMIPAVFLSGAAPPDTGTNSAAELDKVIVTASRLSTGSLLTARTVTIIDRGVIETLPARSIAEILEYVAGADIRRRGAGGVQADAHIRGGTFEQTLVCINGVRVNDAQTAHHDLNLPVAPEDIERIEILHGHAARLYGPDAAGGVINVITKSDTTTTLNAAVESGAHGFLRGYGGGAFVRGPFLATMAASRDRSDGYRYDTDFDIMRIHCAGTLRFQDLTEELFVGYIDNAFGANGFYTSSDEWEHVKTLFSYVKGRIDRGRWGVDHKIYWRNNRDEWIYSRAQPELSANTHTSNSAGAEIQGRYRWRGGATAVALMAGLETIRSANLGDHERFDGGLAAEHQLVTGDRFIVVPGILVHYYSEWGINLFPGIDMALLFPGGWKIRGSAGRTFQIPSYTEYYFDHPVIRGDAQLHPAEGLSFEAGAGYRRDFITADIAGFSRHGRNTIDWLIDSAGIQTAVGREISTRGAEFRLSLFPGEMSGRIPVSRVWTGYGYMDTELDSRPGYESKYYADPMVHQVFAGLGLYFVKHMANTWLLKYEQRAGRTGVTLVDTRINLTIRRAVLFAEITNIFNCFYEDVHGVPMPGRWFKAGIRISTGGITVNLP